MKLHVAILLAIIAAVGIGVPAYLYFDKKTTTADASPFVASPSFGQAGAEAFGSLASLEVAASRSAAEDAIGTSLPSLLPELGAEYRISYVGEPLELTAASVNVLERQVPESRSVSEVFRGSNFGVIDLDAFPQSAVQSFVVTQGTDDGYSISVDLQNGTASISGLSSSVDAARCIEGRCAADGFLTIEEVPTDTEIIAAADAFVARYGIATEAYGDSVIAEDWKQSLAVAESGMSIAEYVQVIYPLQLEGKTAYSLWGDISGMTVGVNLRTMTVTGVYNIANQAYKQSAYSATQDASRIIEAVERGGVYGAALQPAENAVEIQYGTPSMQLVVMSRTNANATYSEILVPALVFPVVSDPQGWHRPIVVPLVEELFEQQFPVTIDAVPPSTGAGSSSGSAGAAIDLPISSDPSAPDLGY